MTLALLLTAVTGAWAQEETLLTTINASSDFISGSKTFDGVATVTITGDIAYDEMTGYGWSAKYSSPGGSVSVEPAEGNTISSCKFYFNNNETYTISTAPFVLYPTTVNGSSFTIYTGPNNTGEMLYSYGIKKIEVYGAAEPAIDVTPVTGKTNEWTFTMPAFDVEIAPIYAPTAQWAKVENVDQLPTAIEGIYAESTDAIVKAGTVAKIGETENPQGIVMYAITSTNQATAPALSAFSADVPTAKDITTGSDVLVWYYIKGADTPEGQEATAENTFNDSEICATPITVTVLSNKFDINFKAANDNTIDAGKATVKVGDEAAEVKEGKLTGVKMDSKVTVTAKDGYKFRKVEVKKKAAAKPLANATTEDLGKVVCAAGHLHDAKTAVPSRCTAVGILGKVTTTGHGLILALSDATSQTWNTINGWASASYAGTTLKVLPDAAALGTNLTSYTTLGETTVSNWAVAQKSDYETIFTNLGSTRNSGGMTYDNNVNAYITTGVGGTAMSGTYWSATQDDDSDAWYFQAGSWYNEYKTDTWYVRPVLGF